MLGMDFKEYFKNKKITVMGLGLLGRGVGDVTYLAEAGADLIVTDVKTEEELKESLEQLSEFKNITYVLGEHREENFKDRDMILVAAGVPSDSKYLTVAKDNGIELVMSGALFAKLSGVPIIGITGTRGKSTVTHMIHHTLEVATEEKILLGGNVRGVSNLQLLSEVQDGSLAVMELDSWQLQGFGWAGISPQIAVFTNFMEDHLNYYKKKGASREEAMSAYFADKANIFLNQEDTGAFVTIPDVFDRAKEFAEGKNITIPQEVILTDISILPDDCLLGMPGEHNRLNAALAYEALRALSLSKEHIEEGLTTFSGVPGRLEYLKEIDGVKIYNDNNATTPQATTAGLRAVGENRNVVLIAGGTDKDIDLAEFVKEIETSCTYVILYAGSGTEKLKKLLPKTVEFEEHEMLSVCVDAALKHSENGDVLLFSPAFSSFGKYYKNEYDRGDQFVDLINQQ